MNQVAADLFDDAVRALGSERSRRSAFGIIAATLAGLGWLPAKTEARRRCRVRDSERQILRYIRRAAKKYHQSEHAMVRVARCESNLDPCAYNRSGPYYGLYQYLKDTWKRTPYGDHDIWDPKAQAFATAWKWKRGEKNEWACK